MMEQEGPTRPRGYVGHLWLILIVTLLVVVFAGALSLDMAGRQVHDTDGYMRLVRVQELADGSTGWFDSMMVRSNAPYGHTMHWTRAMDVVLMIVAGPLLLLGAELDSGLYWSAVLIGPLLLIAFALAVTWAARPLVGFGAPVAGLIAALQPAVGSYSVAGRPDHHSLIALTVAIVLGGSIRLARSGGPPGRVVVMTGLAGAVGMWTSPEVLIALVFSTIGLVGVWILGSRVHLRPIASVWAVVAGGLAVLSAVERGSDVFAIEYDRLSLPHVVLAALAAATIWFLDWLRLRFPEGSKVARGALAFGSGLPALVVMRLAFPGFLGGPFADVPPELADRWLNRVAELATLIGVDGFGAADAAILFLPAVGSVIAVWMAVRSPAEDRGAWTTVAVWTVAGFLLTFAGARFGVYSQTVAAVAVAYVVTAVVRSLSSRGSLARLVGTVGVVSAAAFSWFAVAEISGVLLESDGPGADGAPDCSVSRLAAEHGNLWNDEMLVLAAIDRGPEILYRTDASVVGSPYHRNVAGILDTFDVFEGPSAGAGALLAERGVDVVLVCPGFDAKDYPAAGDDSLYRALAVEAPPPFLELQAGGAEAGGFLVYQVRDSA